MDDPVSDFSLQLFGDAFFRLYSSFLIHALKFSLHGQILQ